MLEIFSTSLGHHSKEPSAEQTRDFYSYYTDNRAEPIGFSDTEKIILDPWDTEGCAYAENGVKCSNDLRSRLRKSLKKKDKNSSSIVDPIKIECTYDGPPVQFEKMWKRSCS